MILAEAINIYNIMQNQIDKNENLSLATKFEMLSIMNDLKKDVDNYVNLKNEYVQKYGTPDENGGFSIAVDDESYSQFQEELTTLLHLNCNEPRHISFEHVSEAKLSASELLILYNILDN